MTFKYYKDGSELPVSEIFSLTADDLCAEPQRLSMDGPASLLTCYFWCSFRDDPDKPPIHYFRSFFRDRLRSGGIIRMGDTPTSVYSVLDEDICPIGEKLIFRERSDGGLPGAETYQEYSSRDGRLCFRIAPNVARVIEGDVIDLCFEHLPYAVVWHSNSPISAPDMSQQAVVRGTYHGRTVETMGGWDRIFNSSVMESTYGKLLSSVVFSGQRPDMSHEWGIVVKYGDLGMGFYCHDGEKPVFSDDVKLNAHWSPIEYLEDGTAVCTDAVFSFGGKEIHYLAKWGYRGWDKESITSTRKSGYSLSTGEWYEGKGHYRHLRSFTMGENHEAFMDKL